MIQLPKIEQDPITNSHLCKCRPICKSRRRNWKGELQNTSAELLLERKPLPECFRRFPTKVYPNSPCPLFSRSRRVTVKVKNYIQPRDVVRICQAPLDVGVDTTYLKYAQLAMELEKINHPTNKLTVESAFLYIKEECKRPGANGAWQAVKACCAFCECNGCCVCPRHGYELNEEACSTRRLDMRRFDTRVKQDGVPMKIMYQ